MCPAAPLICVQVARPPGCRPARCLSWPVPSEARSASPGEAGQDEHGAHEARRGAGAAPCGEAPARARPARRPQPRPLTAAPGTTAAQIDAATGTTRIAAGGKWLPSKPAAWPPAPPEPAPAAEPPPPPSSPCASPGTARTAPARHTAPFRTARGPRRHGTEQPDAPLALFNDFRSSGSYPASLITAPACVPTTCSRQPGGDPGLAAAAFPLTSGLPAC
jgi:hypothetical protein